jgi:cytochrome c oxidase subunit 1
MSRTETSLERPAPEGSWLTTSDPKRIGVMYLASVLIVAGLGGLFALAIRFEMLGTARTVLSEETLARLSTLHGALMAYAFAVPAIPGALGNLLLPRLVGAKNVAFPRLSLASLYLYWVGALVLVVWMLVASLDTGWSLWRAYASSLGSTLPGLVALLLLGLSAALTSFDLVATIHRARNRGLAFHRMPPFVHGLFAGAVVQIGLTLALAVGMVALAPRGENAPLAWRDLLQLYGNGAVYAALAPALGLVGNVLAGNADRPATDGTLTAASFAIASSGVVVWGVRTFATAGSGLSAAMFSFLSFVVAGAAGVQVYACLRTMRHVPLRLSAATVLALGAVVAFTLGQLGALFLNTLSVNIHLHGTYFELATLHFLVLSGATALLAGVHEHWTELTGRTFSETAGRVASLLFLAGIGLAFFTALLLGSRGMVLRQFEYPEEFQSLQVIASAGTFVAAAGALLMFYYLVASLFRAPAAAAVSAPHPSKAQPELAAPSAPPRP